jgi:hypothetical protein
MTYRWYSGRSDGSESDRLHPRLRSFTLARMDRPWSLRIAAAGIALAGALALSSCSGRGDKAFDQRCSGDNDCATGLCVGGAHGADPVCTTSCGRADDCPEGWSCSGVTAANVLVCTHGNATPFGR